MFFSKSFIRYVFTKLKDISTVDSDSIRKIKVSQLRHLLAVSYLIRSENIVSKKLDLTPDTGAHRLKFKTAVGEIVRLNDFGLYTQDFHHSFEEAKDYKTGNNFLTTMVRWNGPYPGQKKDKADGPVLEISETNGKKIASYHKKLKESLDKDYNLKNIKVALVCWIVRFENLSNVDHQSDLKKTYKEINKIINEKFDVEISSHFKFSINEFQDFITESGLEFSEMLSDSVSDLAFLRSEFEKKYPSKEERDSLSTRLEDSEPYLIVFAGPPGTGKTRCAKILAELIVDRKEIPSNLLDLQSYPYGSRSEASNSNVYSVQFHPSYSYEEFMEGLRPVSVRQTGKSDVVYEVVPGVFKAAVEVARSYFEKSKYKIELGVGYEPKTSWQIAENASVRLYRLMNRVGEFLFRGKTITKILNPGINEFSINTDTNPTEGEGLYKIQWKPLSDENINVVLTIDEFNRGNPSVIFGEALTCLEITKRIGQLEEMEISLPYSGQSLKIPPNFHIVASMNTSDRTLSNIDLALKRRFKFVYLKPNFDLLDSSFNIFSIHGEDIVEAVKSHFVAVNSALFAAGISVDQYVGHSYAFMALNRIKQNLEKESEWKKSVINILNDIWRFELHEIIRSVLGPMRIDKFSSCFAEKLANTNWAS